MDNAARNTSSRIVKPAARVGNQQIQEVETFSVCNHLHVMRSDESIVGEIGMDMDVAREPTPRPHVDKLSQASMSPRGLPRANYGALECRPVLESSNHLDRAQPNRKLRLEAAVCVEKRLAADARDSLYMTGRNVVPPVGRLQVDPAAQGTATLIFYREP